MKCYSRFGGTFSENDAGWKPLVFPGGEAHVALGLETKHQQVARVESGSGDELMLLAMWADACNRSGQYSTAVIPYLPGARQDRGTPLGARVYADLLNSMKIDRIVCFDPHSDVLPAMIDRLISIPLEKHPFWASNFRNFDGVIAPDIGARKRAEAVASILDAPVYQAMKHRDFKTGTLSSFTCESLPTDGKFLLVDDICDGGGTFVGLAERIKQDQGWKDLSLWVSHGIFSKGIDTLNDYFDAIHTTDSHVGVLDEEILEGVDLHPLLPFLLGEADKVS